MAQAGAKGERLIAGDFDGLRRNWVVDGARAVDWTLARLRASRPVVLVSGFWRSGTTWLQESLAESLRAKTVFEPLSPLDPRRRAMVEAAFDGHGDSLQAAIPGPWTEDDPAWPFLDAACTGRHTSNFILNCRRGLRESFLTRVVVKDVRLQFNLPAFNRRFRVPVIHLRRHPCAVTASLLAADWSWSFERASLDRLLPAAVEGRAGIVRDCDRDGLSRIAATWAVTERCADADLAGRPWARRPVYEDLVGDPGPAFAALCTSLGLARRLDADFGRLSASTVAAVAPRDRWRQALTPTEIARIEAIVTRIHPGCLAPWGGPG